MLEHYAPPSSRSAIGSPASGAPKLGRSVLRHALSLVGLGAGDRRQCKDEVFWTAQEGLDHASTAHLRPAHLSNSQ
jgi:hypothetical protein